MATLRQKISDMFKKPTPKSEEVTSTPEPKDPPSEDLPLPEIKTNKFISEPSDGNFDYQMEFVDFLDRNSPKGLSKKFMDMLPYMEISFLSWPAYWIYRGYNWQHSRNTERISVYIQRTYQQAKFMQVAILATGAFVVSISRSPFQIQKIEHKISNDSS
ncbi:hypothetical protein KR038_008024 [Drosophila bunnanda]|nr:hypothetical protein KR038_008024 [Drosophila bunnanda]